MTRKHHGQKAQTLSETDTALHGSGRQAGHHLEQAHPYLGHHRADRPHRAGPRGPGLQGWSQTKRVACDNDLGDHRTLSAQTSKLNSTKQARGPEEWMQPKHRCAYVR